MLMRIQAHARLMDAPVARWRLASVVMPLMLTALAACGPDALAPAPPEMARVTSTRAMPALPPVPLSVVDAPISYALTPALAALEQTVPRRFGDIEKRLLIPSNDRQSVAYFAQRSPFTVAFDGKRLTLATVVSYKGRGWYRPAIGPTVSASCGTDEASPRVRVVITTDVEVAPDWHLRTKTRIRSMQPVSVEARDQCRVTMFKIDVTQRVIDAIKPLLAQRMPEVDRKIGAFDVRTRVEQWYNLLNKGIRVRDSLWLMLAPENVRLGGLRFADSALIADVRLFARPTLVTGPKPPTPVSTLPMLDAPDHTVGDSAHLRLEGLLGYDIASVLLAKELVGRSFSRLGRRIVVRRVRLYPIGDGRVSLALGISGAVEGDAYFVGTPTLDTAARTLTVPDLDFDLATANALVKGLAWIKRGDVVSDLRRRAQVKLDPVLEDTRAKVEGAINRDLTEGVHLAGVVRTGRLLDVAAGADGIVVRAEATGSLGLAIDKAIPIGRSRHKSSTGTAATGNDKE
jgi:hypothetical protein